MREKRTKLRLSDAEYRLLLHSLVHWRNKLLTQRICTDPIDELLIRLQKPRGWWHG